MRDSWRSPERPKFRTDLIVEPASGGESAIFVVRAPGSTSRCTLDDVELSLARLMDGERTVEGIEAEAQRLGIPVSVDRLEKLIRQLAANGLLENAEASVAGASVEAKSNRTFIQYPTRNGGDAPAPGQTPVPGESPPSANNVAVAQERAMPIGSEPAPSTGKTVAVSQPRGLPLGSEPAPSTGRTVAVSQTQGTPLGAEPTPPSERMRALAQDWAAAIDAAVPPSPSSAPPAADSPSSSGPMRALGRNGSAESASAGDSRAERSNGFGTPAPRLGDDSPKSSGNQRALSLELPRTTTEPTMLAVNPGSAPPLGEEAAPPSERRRALSVELPSSSARRGALGDEASSWNPGERLFEPGRAMTEPTMLAVEPVSAPALGDEAPPPSERRRALSGEVSVGSPAALREEVPSSRNPGKLLFEPARAMTEPMMLAVNPATAPRLGDEAPPPSERRRAFPVEMPRIATEAEEWERGELLFESPRTMTEPTLPAVGPGEGRTSASPALGSAPVGGGEPAPARTTRGPLGETTLLDKKPRASAVLVDEPPPIGTLPDLGEETVLETSSRSALALADGPAPSRRDLRASGEAAASAEKSRALQAADDVLSGTLGELGEATVLEKKSRSAPTLGDEAAGSSMTFGALAEPAVLDQKGRPAFPAGIEPVTDPMSVAASPAPVDSPPAGAPTVLDVPAVTAAAEPTVAERPAPATTSPAPNDEYSAARDMTGASGSDETRAMLQAGLTLMKRGWFDEAERTFSQILEKQPQHPEAGTLLEMVRERQARGTPSEIPAFEPPPKPPLTTLEALEAIKPGALWKDRRVVAFAAGLVLLVLFPIAGAVISVPAELVRPAALEPAARAQVSAPSDRVVASVAVEPGDKVDAKQVLATLEMLTAAADRERLSAEVERIEAELAILKRGASAAELAKAKAEAAARSKALKRVMRQLARIKNQNDPALLELEGERKAALAAAREADQRLKLLLQARKTDAVSRKQIELEAARLHKAALDRRADASQILAPVAGRVTTALPKSRVGSEVRQGELLFEVMDTSRMLARLEIAEKALEVRPGAAASFSDGSASAQGKVTRVELVEGTKAIIHVELDNASGALKAGAKGELWISLGERSLWAAAFGD